ncbi:MAG TPA: glucokinase [Candidatus Acidoferrales bacterium]|nr:glucokinase [Candidatus Acidoferrales bacterium]
MILAGDVGGTKSNLGLFDVQQGALVRLADKRYPSREHRGLEEIVKDFVATTGAKVTAASFGIAGPVVDYKVRAGNLPWIIDGATLASQLGLDRVRLMNDLEATAYGISVMGPGDLDTIYAGVPAPQAPRAVIAAGTGLGEAILFWDGTKHVPTATEGGHADFAPHTEQQVELWRFIKARSEFVSNELLLSGRGFRTVHEFLDSSVRHPGFDDPTIDPAPGITRMALAKECPVCVATLQLWVEIYGSEAGNLAVRTVARGGIYVAGGIAVKILPLLKDGRFAAAARHKEKMQDFLAQVPIHVVLDEECPLKGAAYVASKGL